MSNPATEKLARILKLEAQKGYSDTAVTSGLKSFAPTWLADAERHGIEPDRSRDIAERLHAYSATTDIAHRREGLNGLLVALGMSAVTVLTPNRVAAPPTPQRPAAPEPPDDASRSPRASTTQTRPDPQRRNYGLGLDAPVTKVNGIGEFNAKKLEKLGVFTIRDMLYHFPARYDDYSALKTIGQLFYGEQVTIVARVARIFKTKTKSSLMMVKATLEDASGSIDCTWFTSERFVDNLMKQLAPGRDIVLSGKVGEYLGRLTFQNPTHEPAEREWLTGGSVVPVYPLTEGLQPLLLRRAMKRVSEYWSQRVPEFLPASVIERMRLPSIGDALRDIHFPPNLDVLEHARRRLAFDELFVLQMAVLKQRAAWRGEAAPELRAHAGTLERCIAALPYTLTGAQQRALRAITDDIQKPIAMHRLLQGDVGSGKTVVAALAMAMAASVGAQSALMAPTEILAEQHFKGLSRLFEAMNAQGALAKPAQIALLTGSVKAAAKRKINAALAAGEIDVVIGTHALIQDGVEFHNLGFVVVDEQHRFGVNQRTALRQKGALAPHTLVMTATPIPRTLALTLYGDLDNTVLDEMPPGRQPIDTHWYAPADRERAYAAVRAQIEQGRQAFVICPLVEETDKIEAKAAVEEYERLKRDVFTQYSLGLLHGKMKAAEKDAAMQAFAANQTQILVSTSVVEVGIDVPNATIMMIEGANRFGLSQLHQFRGRVGRGQHKSFCLLISDSSSATVDQRLQAIVSTQDGFKLAEVDLEMRGPGEFFGTRQSGDPELRLVGIKDRDLLTVAREEAEHVIQIDPNLEAPAHALLAERVRSFWSHRDRGDAS